MKIKVGDIFFINGDGLFGKVITLYNKLKFKRSDVTHVGIISKRRGDEYLIYESVASGFLSSWYHKDFLNRGISNNTIKIKTPKIELGNVFKTCKKYEGTKYGKINIIFHGINLFLSLFLLPKIKYTDGIVSGHCSEMVSRVLYDCSNKKIDFEQEYNKPFDNISPQEIYMSKFLK